MHIFQLEEPIYIYILYILKFFLLYFSLSLSVKYLKEIMIIFTIFMNNEKLLLKIYILYN